MAAFTSKATGNWNATGQTTWNEVGTPGAGDTWTIASGHTITVTADVTTAGGTFEGPITVANGVSFTHTGTVTQGNAVLTLGAGSKLIGDTTAGHVKFLQGTASNQTSCRIVCNGTANGGDDATKPPATTGGNHAQIKKTGSNSYWVDGADEFSGSISNVGGWDCTYTDFLDLGHNSSAFSIRSNDFGNHHRYFLHCVFDNCKMQFANTWAWDASGNKDWRVEYCRWTNQRTGQPDGATGMRYVFASPGTGTKTFKFNSVGDPGDNKCMTCGPRDTNLEDCYFDSGLAMTGVAGCLPVRCTIRAAANTQGAVFNMSGGTWGPTYYLADHVDPADRVFGTTAVGNMHYTDVFGTGTFDGILFEYPHELLIDQADGCYGKEDGTFALATIQRCLSIPSMTDGYVATNIHPMIHGNNRVKLYHNTIAGKAAQLIFNERNMIEPGVGPFTGRTGTAQAGGASTITLDAGASATDDFYINQNIFISGGTGAGQKRYLTDYVGATKVATVSVAWATAPDNTSQFIITEIPVDECKSNLVAGVSLTGNEWGAICYDLNSSTVDQRDTMTPANTVNNYVYMPVAESASVPGSENGAYLRLSEALPGTNQRDTVQGPQFVDARRNAARWARSIGLGDPEPEQPALPVSFPAWNEWYTWKRDILDALRVYLMANPTAGYETMMPWVKAGFVVTNPALNMAGHDGDTIGAMGYQSPGTGPALAGEGPAVPGRKPRRPAAYAPGRAR